MSDLKEKKDDVIKVDVNRSAVEKELQDKLEVRAAELATLQEQYKNSVDALEKLKGENKDKSDDFQKVIEERDGYKNQIREIALEKFEEEKKTLLEKLNAVLPEDKVKEMTAELNEPKDLQSVGYALSIMEQINKSIEERQAEEQIVAQAAAQGNTKAPPAAQVSGDGDRDDAGNTIAAGATPPQTNPQTPPRGSAVRTPQGPDSKWIFKDAKEAIDTLYAEMRQGNREADRMLNEYWAKAFQLIRNQYGRLQMSVTECPACGTGIDTSVMNCPYCDFDVQQYTGRGGEFW